MCIRDSGSIRLNGIPPIYTSIDQRSFYAMASYKFSDKLAGGLYYSSSIDRQAAFTSARYEKDWACLLYTSRCV